MDLHGGARQLARRKSQSRVSGDDAAAGILPFVNLIPPEPVGPNVRRTGSTSFEVRPEFWNETFRRTRGIHCLRRYYRIVVQIRRLSLPVKPPDLLCPRAAVYEEYVNGAEASG